MRRKYLLVGGSLLLFALAATLLLFGNVNTSEFSTGVATGAVLTGFGLLVWAIQTAVIEGKEQKVKPTRPPSRRSTRAATESIERIWSRLVRRDLRKEIVSNLEGVLSGWRIYTGASPPERWLSLSNDGMRQQAAAAADEILRVTAKHPDLWDATTMGKLNVISGELRQFAATVHPETAEDAVAMDQHGETAYALTGALLPRISKPKLRSAAAN